MSNHKSFEEPSLVYQVSSEVKKISSTMNPSCSDMALPLQTKSSMISDAKGKSLFVNSRQPRTDESKENERLQVEISGLELLYVDRVLSMLKDIDDEQSGLSEGEESNGVLRDYFKDFENLVIRDEENDDSTTSTSCSEASSIEQPTGQHSPCQKRRKNFHEKKLARKISRKDHANVEDDSFDVDSVDLARKRVSQRWTRERDKLTYEDDLFEKGEMEIPLNG